MIDLKVISLNFTGINIVVINKDCYLALQTYAGKWVLRVSQVPPGMG